MLYGAAGFVVIAGAVAATAVISFSGSSQTIGVTITAFSTKPPYTVTFRVDKPAAEAVNCDVYEIDFRDQPVGQVLGLHVGAAKQSAVLVTVTVPVTGTPVQPQVEECVRGESAGQLDPNIKPTFGPNGH